ncbi:MAG: AAA family ATPase [Flavobacteriaceae bacterium]|nr:AAA family ATPase [Flavobacteriaceae bacterium]
MKQFDELIDKNEHHASISVLPNNEFEIEENIILEVIFSTFDPKELGIIDYHGAHRNYQKENIQNLNLKFDDENSQYQSHALYNYASKYNNVKTELASSYVKALISRESGVSIEEPISNLNNSLISLFENFFPGKKFQGMIPTSDGKLEFPVKLRTGETHDISELSSGEKEVLFAYLRLRNQALKNSVILIDEPELHLNPKFAKQLPRFYHDTIGKEFDNQVWLVTHSDAILKEVAGNKDYSIYHMSESSNDGENQLRKISLKTEAESALIDLIGEFSLYDKNNKIIIFEGQNSEFDKKMTNTLFPELENSVNSISAGSKSNVTKVQEVLQRAFNQGIITKEFVSIVDRDSDSKKNYNNSNQYYWDVYHIENYLIHEKYILQVLMDIGLNSPKLQTEIEVLSSLKVCAEKVIDFHLQYELNSFVKKEVYTCLSFSPKGSDSYAAGFHKSFESSLARLVDKGNNHLSFDQLKNQERIIRNKLKESLESDKWNEDFNGRMVLKRFVSDHCKGIDYETFRNLIIAKMNEYNYQPAGMRNVIDKIIR